MKFPALLHRLEALPEIKVGPVMLVTHHHPHGICQIPQMLTVLMTPIPNPACSEHPLGYHALRVESETLN